MDIVLRDMKTGEYAVRNGWSATRTEALSFPTLVEAQSFCGQISACSVEAIVERPNGPVFAIVLVDVD